MSTPFSVRMVLSRAVTTAVLVLATVVVLMEVRAWWQVLIGALVGVDAVITATLLLLYLRANRVGDR